MGGCTIHGRSSGVPLGRWGLVVLLLVVGGCKPSVPSADVAHPEAKPVEKRVERGPVRMTVRVDKDEATIAHKFHLTIEVTAADGVDVEMPHFVDKLSAFEIDDFEERAAAPCDEGRVWTQDYILASVLSGEHEISGITVKFTDNRERSSVQPSSTHPAEPIKSELTAEPLTITVTSLLTGEFDPTTFRDIKGAVELPTEPSWTWLWWTVGAVGVLAMGGVGIGFIRGRKGREAEPAYVSPYEKAFHGLLRLEEDRLVDQGLFHEFYFRLTDIIREYIEGQFGLMAPERTTDEFLQEMRDHRALSREHKGLLGEFLQAADLVKFARYEPAPAETERAFGAAQDFVNQTGQSQSEQDMSSGVPKGVPA